MTLIPELLFSDDAANGSSLLFCAPGRIRTYGLSLRRRTLYPLSYEGGEPSL